MSTLAYPSFSPYITVHNAEEAIAFYQKAFGAKERFRLADASSGKIGHAELDLQGSLLMLSDENPAWNKSPQTRGGTPCEILPHG
jgi:PhnB protein